MRTSRNIRNRALELRDQLGTEGQVALKRHRGIGTPLAIMAVIVPILISAFSLYYAKQSAVSSRESAEAGKRSADAAEKAAQIAERVAVYQVEQLASELNRAPAMATQLDADIEARRKEGSAAAAAEKEHATEVEEAQFHQLAGLKPDLRFESEQQVWDGQGVRIVYTLSNGGGMRFRLPEPKVTAYGVDLTGKRIDAVTVINCPLRIFSAGESGGCGISIRTSTTVENIVCVRYSAIFNPSADLPALSNLLPELQQRFGKRVVESAMLSPRKDAGDIFKANTQGAIPSCVPYA